MGVSKRGLKSRHKVVECWVCFRLQYSLTRNLHVYRKVGEWGELAGEETIVWGGLRLYKDSLSGPTESETCVQLKGGGKYRLVLESSGWVTSMTKS